MHPCENCPMIQEEIKKRLTVYGEEMLYDFPEDRDQIITNDIIKYCWCEKTGYKLWATGICEEVILDKLNKNPVNVKHSSRHRKTKRERDRKYKRHLRFLADNITHYPSPAYPAKADGNFVLEDEQHLFAYYKRIYQSCGKRSRVNLYKKISNRKIRRYKDEIPNGRWCHKLFDFWWEIY